MISMWPSVGPKEPHMRQFLNPIQKRTLKKIQNAAQSTAMKLMFAMLPASKAKPRKSAKTAVNKAPPPPRTPKGRVKKARFSCDLGARDYWLYTPAGAAPAPQGRPLLVMLHGCGQTPEEFARATQMNSLAEEFGFCVLYPIQSATANRNRCWNWYEGGDHPRTDGEAALLAAMIQDVSQGHSIDPERVYVAGLSAGAAAALGIAATFPELIAAVGAHSGLPWGAAKGVISALIAMKTGNPGHKLGAQMPTILFHGDKDTVVHPRNGRFALLRSVEAYDGLTVTRKSGKVAGGHSFTRTQHRSGSARVVIEEWVVHGLAHAWSGGGAVGKHSDPLGPDASREMVKFFLRHKTTKATRSAAARVAI
jgi:poly(hydroxyalkanoate) depolymerase family esterase